MNRPAKITGYIAAGMMAIQFLFTILITVAQNPVVRLTASPYAASSPFVFPIVSILRTLALLMVLGIYCLVISTRRNYEGKEKLIGILFAILYGVLQLIFTYAAPLENMIYSHIGSAMHLAKLSSVSSIISMVNAPFAIAGTILIGLSFGCVFMQGNMKNDIDD